MKNREIRRAWFITVLLMFVFFILAFNTAEASVSGSLTAPVRGFSVIDDTHVYFGSYPQREIVRLASQSGVYGNSYWGTTSTETNDQYIVDSELYNTLKGLSEADWNSNDATVDGAKYRRIKKGNATYSTSGSSYYYNWSDTTTYHYFKYEPIKWRVLKATEDDAFLLCDMAIDDQRYNTSNTSITWEKSTIRSWLNSCSSNFNSTNYSGKGFYDLAFNATEKGAIKTTNVVNSNNKSYGTNGGNNTQDKIFLLSEDEVYGSNAIQYGFASSSSTYDTARQMKSSTFAKAMGAYATTSNGYYGNCRWWLRSPGDSTYYAAIVYTYGSVYQDGGYVYDYNYGVLPALHLNLKSTNPMYAISEISDITLSSDVMYYTGEELKPVVSIEGLSEGEDFEVSYEDNTEVGTAKVIVTGVGECAGTLTKTFEIKKDITKVEFGLSKESYTYTGEECKPKILSNLAVGAEYLLEYSNNINVGTAKVTIVGCGDYYGTKELQFTINPKSIESMEATLEKESVVYNRKAQTPAVEIEGLKKDTDFAIAYTNNTNAGTATVTITGKGNYTGTIEKTFTIERCDISDMTATISQDEYVQDGNAKTPTVSITGLTSGTDYDVEYSDNVEIGTATVTITGKINYTGTIEKHFRIGKNISSLEATLSQDTYTYDGEAKTPTVTIEGLTEDTDFTVEYTNNINAGTATVTIKSAGDYVGKITKNFTIKKHKYSEEGKTTGSLTGPDKSKIYFGSYPQREVVGEASQSGVYGKSCWGTTSTETNDQYIVDSELYNTLKGLSEADWNSNDAIVDGAKYRRIKKGNATYSTSGSSYYYNWSDTTTYHYFKYEPIKWRVLKATEDDAFLLCDMAIDDQRYNTSSTSITWEKSTIRSWLNSYGSSSNSNGTNYIGKGFYDLAFNATEKSVIKTTEVVNANNKSFGTNGGNNTQDKIFLLSEDEVYGSNAIQYGFASSSSTYDTARQMKSSTFAKAMGANADTSSGYYGNCYWWLRSPGYYTDNAAYVYYSGNVDQGGNNVDGNSSGLLPALHLNLKSTNPMYAISETSDITLSSDVMCYTGEELKPVVSIEGMTEGEDFEVSYEDNTEVGTAKVIVTGIGECSGTLTKTFEIIDADTLQLSESTYTYDGSAKTPSVVVKGIKADTTLNPETDYDVEYEDNTNAGTAKAIITLKGNYDGSLVKTFTIKPQDMSNREASLSSELYLCESKEEDRDEKKPTVTVEGLSGETDYTVDYSNNINPGTATATIKGKGNYTGTIVKTFRIGFMLEGTVELSQKTFVYDGTAKTPTATLEGYVEGTDFEVTYLNNIEPGTATVKLTGIGNYIQAVSTTFTIEKGNFKDASVELASNHCGYYDTAVEPEVIVKIGDAVIPSDNYTLTYTNNKKTGTGTVTVNSKTNGMLTGSTTKTFEIHALNKVAATDPTCKDYGNSEYYTCSCGKYYSDKFGINEITENSWVIDKTNHTYEDVELKAATIEADGYKKHQACSFCGAEKDKVVIPQIDASSITLSETSYIVDGTEHEPEVSTILDVDGNELDPNTDYDIAYSDNKFKGIGKAVITFKGNYAGEVIREFSINKKGTEGIVMEISENEYTYDGTAKEPSVTVTWNEGEEFPTENYDIVYENNKNAGTASAKVVLKGDYYEGELVTNFTIHKAQYTLDVEQTQVKPRVGKTAQIKATGNGKIVYTSGSKSIASVSDAGIVKGVKIGASKITISIADDDNHIGVSKTIDVIVPTVITKAALSASSYTYDNNAHKPSVKTVNGSSTKYKLDRDYSIKYTDANGDDCNAPTEAGTYKVIVTGIGNCDGTTTLTYKINQAAKTFSGVPASVTAYISKDAPEISATTNDDTAVSYKINNTKYADISASGGTCTITAKKAGTATLTISAPASKNYKSGSKTVKITVKDPVNINSTKVTTIGKAYWNNGEAISPSVTVKSGKTTFKKDTDYKVNYELVNEQGESVSDWEVGNYVRVTVDATDENMLACKGSYTKDVKIEKASQSATATAPATIYYGTGKEAVKIALANIPTTEGDDNPTISYTSSNKKYATVDDEGNITPLKAGKVTITVNIGATKHYAAKTIKLTVNVKAAVSLSSKNVKMTVGYNGGDNVVPTVTVTGYKLGDDYTVEYDNSGITQIGQKITVKVKAVTASGGCLGSYENEIIVGKGTQVITIDAQPSTVKAKSTTDTFTISGVKDEALVSVTTKTYAKINELGGGQYSVSGIKKGTATVTIKIAATDKYNAKTMTFKVKVTK